MRKTIIEQISELEALFSSFKNEEQALAMSKYMNGRFSYFGISSPKRREIQTAWFVGLKSLSLDEKWALIEELWIREEREFHYVAIDFLKKWRKTEWREQDIDKLEWLITQNSWWDTVDLIASNMLGICFQKFPGKRDEKIKIWRKSPNFWLNRCCLIFQLKYKTEVDFDLLKSLILDFKENKEFFIQKAIGWSLRSYADFFPEKVSKFVNEIDLQGLARREALRKI